MVELVDNMNHAMKTHGLAVAHTRVYSFRILLRIPEGQWALIKALEWKYEKDIRFPWIHKRDPVTFQFSNVLPWVNHSAVPS